MHNDAHQPGIGRLAGTTDKTVLVISTGVDPREVVGTLAGAGWQVIYESDLRSAGDRIEHQGILVGLLLLGETDAAQLLSLSDMMAAHRNTEWIALVAPDSFASEAVRSFVVDWCYDFHTMPLDGPRLLHALGHAHGKALLKASQEGGEGDQPGSSYAGLVGDGSAMQALRRRLALIAATDASVLILGESGCGKELAARAIHFESPRKDARFVAVNCAALPPTLVQSELFGYEKGAFTGASQMRKGLLETAAGGTIFLDEIGDLPLEQQANLLRFLETRTIVRLGSTEAIPVDVRVVAATHVDLQQAIAARRFRQDLYYRLNVVSLYIPPLRERRDDIRALAEHFFRKYMAERPRSRARGFSRQAMRAMLRYDWPGNVRELMNRVHSAVILSEGLLISAQDLGLAQPADGRPPANLEQAREAAERDAIQASLLRNGNNISHAARELGISRITLYRLLSKHGIPLPKPGSSTSRQ